jgi:hypothetical protein
MVESSLLIEEDGSGSVRPWAGMHVAEQVAAALRNYQDVGEDVAAKATPSSSAITLTPDPLAYALGWIAANAVVAARYAACGVDALPIYHPEHGWDRFLLTRRVTAPVFADESPASFGTISLSGPGAPNVVDSTGTVQLSLGLLLRRDPVEAVRQLLALIPALELPAEDLGKRWRERQLAYPMLFHAVTDLLLEYPGLVVARELLVHDNPIDGAYHPLVLHGVTARSELSYDWFLVQFGERAAFFRAHGGQAIYEREPGGWSTVKTQLSDDLAESKTRIAAWLRLVGEPDPAEKD